VLVNEWATKLWPLLNVTKKTRYDYSRLYERHLKPVIGHRDLDENVRQELQLHLLTLPPQTSRHCLMVAKTTWREALNYGVCQNNPTIGIRTPSAERAGLTPGRDREVLRKKNARTLEIDFIS
jgi:hypothetical protein